MSFFFFFDFHVLFVSFLLHLLIFVTNKHRKPVYAIKEMNEKIKVIKKGNEKRKAVIRTQR
jgi:hypothetical protein